MSLSAPLPQPYLHELVTCVRAPTVAISGNDGQLRGGANGVFRHDHRVLSALVVDVDGHPPVPVGHGQPDPGTAVFTGVVRHLGDASADPTVWLQRQRTVHLDGAHERLTLVNASRRDIRVTVQVTAAADFALMGAVKHGQAGTPLTPQLTGADTAVWHTTQARTTLTANPTPRGHIDPAGSLRLAWEVTVPARSRWSALLTITATDVHRTAAASPGVAPTGAAAATTGPPALSRLLARGVADLGALLLADPAGDGDRFAAAGSPWYLTLFGRDSLWAARFTLPLGTDLAGGTLRALARRQGRRYDRSSAEAPGRIPHEVRPHPQELAGGQLVYFGTVDATALWVCLLHDAWRWGLPEAEVSALLDPLQQALRWLTEDADADGDGFLEYRDVTGHGLANQGWKDSHDAIQFPDGTIAEAPIALSEAQAYAYQAALHGAAVLEAFGRPGADRLRRWAAALSQRFRAAYWVNDAHGRFPAIALDGAKRPVGVAASNLGHLLATGLLTAEEAAQVAARLGQPDLDCGYGLRTLSAEAAGFNPLSYHVGSVWPHDTAIAVHGLSREGHDEVARSLAEGLLRAAPRFDYRLPELFAGTDARAGEPALAYPAACRPQAWSATAAVPLLQAALGLSADVPAGVVTVQPRLAFADWFPLRVEGLQVAGHRLDIVVDADGAVEVQTTAPVRVVVEPPAPHVPQVRPAPAVETVSPASQRPSHTKPPTV